MRASWSVRNEVEMSGRTEFGGVARRRARRAGVAIAGALALLSGSGCVVVSAQPYQLTGITVADRGFDPGGESCKEFKLDASQATVFFQRAALIDAKELEDDFDTLPCFVRGSALGHDGQVSWEIRAGGTASVTASDGSVRTFGCSDCEDLLQYR